jgi:CHAT domain-containing protein
LASISRSNEQLNLKNAESEYEIALRIFTEHDFPFQWAEAQLALAGILEKSAAGSRSDNFTRALTHAQKALRVFTEKDFPLEWARAQCSLANLYEDLPTGKRSDNLNKALNYFGAALRVYTADSSPLEWAGVEIGIAQIYTRLPTNNWASDLNKAIASCLRVLETCSEQRSPRHWARAQVTLGDAYRGMRDKRQERIHDALDCYSAALRVTTKETFPLLWADIHMSIGRVYEDDFTANRLDNIKQSIEHFNLALEVLTREEYPQTWGRLQDALGGAFVSWPARDDTAPLETALAHYNAALKVFTQRDYPEDWARTLNNIGGAYAKLRTADVNDNLAKALEGYRQAEKVFTEQDYPVDWAMLQSNIGKAYSELGTGDRQDNIKRSIACFHAALSILNETEFPLSWGNCQHNLGASYAELASLSSNDFEPAINCYLASLRVLREHDHPVEWARSQNSLGSVYRKKGDETSLSLGKEALDAALRVYTEQSFPWDWALVQNNLGALCIGSKAGDRAGNLRTAIHHFQCALRIYAETTSPSSWAMAQSNMGASYIYLKEIEPATPMAPAIDAFRAALRVLPADVWPLDRLNVLLSFSTACYREHLWEDTLALSVESIALLEKLRIALLTGQERHRVLSEYSAMFERAVIACVELKRFREAFLYVERGKTRNLMDSLVRRDTRPRGVSPKDWNTYLELLGDLRNLERELQSGDLSSRTGSIRYPILRGKLERVKDELAKLERTFHSAAPDYLAVANAFEFTDLCTTVRQSKSLLVEFRITERGTYVFLLGSEDEDVFEDQVVHLPDFSNAAIRSLLIGEDPRLEEGWLLTYDRWRRGKVDQTQWMRCLEKTATLLQEQLLRPVLERIRKRYPAEKRLLLVPNQRLHLLPLHAAWEESGGKEKYLLDTYEVHYAPSCSVLRRCLEWDKARGERDSLFAVQNPHSDLAFADWDVEEAGHYFKRSCILAGKEATLSRVKDSIELGNEVLLSCHGRYDVSNVWDSELILHGEDRLRQAAIMGLDLSRAWLVVLSACETNVPDYRDVMDEVQGMHTAFLIARAPTVIGTLWSVNDFSTALLMKCFHQNLYINAMGRAEAIRAAQIWLRNLTLQEVEGLLAGKRKELVRLNDPKRIAAIDRIRESSHLTDLAAANNGRPFAHPHWWAAFQCVGAP